MYPSDRLPLPRPLHYGNTAGTATAARVIPSELPGLNWRIHPHPHPHPHPYLAAPVAAAGPLPLAVPTPAPHTSPIMHFNSGFPLGNNSENARGDSDSGNGNNNSSSSNSIVGVRQQFQPGTSLRLPHVAATVGQVGAEVGAGVMAASVGAMGVAAVSATQRQLPRLGTLSHRCPLCDKCFKRKSWLRRHLLSHSPERHFGCAWCLSKHKRKDNLLQHMKLKHTQYVLEELRSQNVEIDGEVRNDNIRTLLYEGRLNKDDVKKVLNALIDRHNG